MHSRLKRVKKVDGEVPEEVQRECSLLHLRSKRVLRGGVGQSIALRDLRKDIDHPFIMTQVNTFETKKSALNPAKEETADSTSFKFPKLIKVWQLRSTFSRS